MKSILNFTFRFRGLIWYLVLVGLPTNRSLTHAQISRLPLEPSGVLGSPRIDVAIEVVVYIPYRRMAALIFREIPVD